MDYYGEHLLPGKIGEFFISLSLVSSLVAAFSYFKATQTRDTEDSRYWRRLGRWAFLVEVFSVLAIFTSLFYIIQHHLFEYKYAWQHSSLSLEFKYMLACFWEGQEGSFLLWSIWHCLIGLVVMRTAKSWEAPVMTVISFAQFCLATMITGLYIFNMKVGSNPFILLRDSGVLDGAPALHVNFDITQPLKQDYMLSIKDGNDLNPLLQNYWMVIHPPVLFLGFASTIVPFAFALAGLWTKQFGSWIKQALPWTLFSTAALGVGIMMGAAWAYESLTFGGYWAWDPVENASLVPWLILVSGLHTLLIYKHTGHSLKSTYLFLSLSFLFVLYSTFLTRTGVLGETSVHAFTGEGNTLYYHLLAFIAVFLAPFAYLFIRYYKEIPVIRKEEQTSSREFWMFIGSLVFFLSSLLIIGKTSLPAFLKIAPPEDMEFSYNQVQIFVAVIVALLTGFSQYLRYKSTDRSLFWKKMLVPAILSALAAAVVVGFGNIDYFKKGPMFLGAIWLAVACSVYAVIANAAYIWLGVKGKLAVSGGSIAHVGFGLVLLGILLSSSKKEILSYNTSGIAIDFGPNSDQNPGENLTLVKGIPMKMGKFDVTYLSDSAHPKKPLWFYKIHFKSRTDKEEFTLYPNAFVNYKGNEGLMANPDSRHYFSHDIFTYISALPNPEKNKDTASFHSKMMREGDSVFYSHGFAILEKLITKDSIPFEGFSAGDKATVATLKVYSSNSTSYTAEPLLIEKGGSRFAQPDSVISESLVFRVNSVADGTADIGIKESNTVMQYVTLKAYKFPYINLLWAGVIITAIGVVMSMVRRIRLNRRGSE